MRVKHFSLYPGYRGNTKSALYGPSVSFNCSKLLFSNIFNPLYDTPLKSD